MDLKELIEECREQMLEVLSQNAEIVSLSSFEKFNNEILPLASSNKVLSVLSQKLQFLLRCSSDQRLSALLELNSVLEKLTCSLLVLPNNKEERSDRYTFSGSGGKEVKYSQVKHLVQALQMKSGARLNLIRESIITETYKSVQLLPYFIDNIDIRHKETAELIVNEILPYYGRTCLWGVRTKVNFEYSRGQGRLLGVLFKYMDSIEVQVFASEVMALGDLGFKKALLKNLKPGQVGNAELESLLKSRSRELRDLALSLVEK